MEMRSKSATDLHTSKKPQHQFRRKTILSKSPIFSCKSSQNKTRVQDVRSKSQPRNYNSLPHRYKLLNNNHKELQQTFSQPRVEPQEFKRRLETILSWVTDFSSDQKTLLVSALFPHLESSQLHFISSRVCSTWRDLSTTNSLWQALCGRADFVPLRAAVRPSWRGGGAALWSGARCLWRDTSSGGLGWEDSAM